MVGGVGAGGADAECGAVHCEGSCLSDGLRTFFCSEKEEGVMWSLVVFWKFRAGLGGCGWKKGRAGLYGLCRGGGCGEVGYYA